MTPCSLVGGYWFWEEIVASIVREAEGCLLTCILRTEAVASFGTVVRTSQTARCHNPGGQI